MELDSVLQSKLKQKAKPKPDERDQGKSNHRYPTRSTRQSNPRKQGPSHHHDNDADIQPPGIDHKQEHQHKYNLRSLNVDFEQQSFHFNTPSIAIDDNNPFPINSIFPAKEIPIHLQPDTHVFLKNYGESTNRSDDIDSNREQPPKIDLEDYEVILRDEHGEPRLDEEGNPITVICRPPSNLLGRVFLTKPDHCGNC